MFRERTISNIITEDFVFARVLDFFGVNFYEYPSKTLASICQERKLSETKVIDQFTNYRADLELADLKLSDYPVDLIIEYLRHAHHVFVKDRLAYIAKLIQSYDVSSSEGAKFMKDLQFIFPLFLKEFIEHIYEEEDHFFSYLMSLFDGLEGRMSYSKLYYLMEKNSVLDFSIVHGNDENEMKGIRAITNNYSLGAKDDIHLHVILKELHKFDEDLVQHASIEDNVLIPKGILLEEEIKKVFREKIRWN